MLVSVRKETESTIPQDFLTGSDTEHTVLTKQTNTTNVYVSKSKMFCMQSQILYLGLI